MSKEIADYHAIALLKFLKRVTISISIEDFKTINGINIQRRTIISSIPCNQGGNFTLYQYRYQMSCCHSPWLTYNQVYRKVFKIYAQINAGGSEYFRELKSLDRKPHSISKNGEKSGN